jgi:hypothetical protein
VWTTAEVKTSILDSVRMSDIETTFQDQNCVHVILIFTKECKIVNRGSRKRPVRSLLQERTKLPPTKRVHISSHISA